MSESGATVVSESDKSIKLGAFLLWKGLANGKDQARQLILDGGVRVNGQIEERPRHRLFDGDVVAVGGRTVTVDLSEPHGFIRLDQFLVWQRLARHSRQAEELIRGGAVRVNGQIVTRRTHRLFNGHIVTLDDKTITVDLRQSRRSIKLDQFLHSQGVGKAGRLIRAGAVRLNGHVESWRSRKLFHGDVVVVVGPLYEGDTVVGAREFKVDLSRPEAAGEEDEEGEEFA